MRGRKPTPSVLNLVRGNPGKRPPNADEPLPEGEATKPKSLRKAAAAVWDEYAPELIRLGILTSVDAPMFAVWCALYAEFEKRPSGMTASRISQMRALASSFGLDSSSRTRIKVKPKEKRDPAERHFGT